MKKLVLFDFDGTLTNKDSFLELIKFKVGGFKYLVGMSFLSPMLILFKLGAIKNYSAKQRVIRYFFGGMTAEQFALLCQEFTEKSIPKMIKEDALRKFKAHIDSGDDVFIVSASAINWVQPWADSFGVEVLGTHLKVVDGSISGEIEGNNCYGQEKVNRIKSRVDFNAYNEIFAYGDSRGDKEMLEMATHPFYRVYTKINPYKGNLESLARK